MTPTIEQHGKDFISAMLAGDAEKMAALPKQLADEDKTPALRYVIKYIKSDAKLTKDHAAVLKTLETADSINTLIEEAHADTAEGKVVEVAKKEKVPVEDVEQVVTEMEKFLDKPSSVVMEEEPTAA